MDIRRAVVEMQARRERNMQEKEIEIQNTVLPILKSVSPEMFTILCKVAKKRVPDGNREHLQGNPSELPLNSVVALHWPLDGVWYCGLVVAYDRTEHMYLIKYYDGDVEWISLQHHACRRLEHLPKGADSVLACLQLKLSNIGRWNIFASDGTSFVTMIGAVTHQQKLSSYEN